MTDSEPVEVWVCPLCGIRVGLYVHAHGQPTCAHIGTPRSAARAVAMIREPERPDAA